MFYQIICLYSQTTPRDDWKEGIEVESKRIRGIQKAEEIIDNSSSTSSSRY